MNVKAAIERKIRVKPPREIQFGGEFGGKGGKGSGDANATILLSTQFSPVQLSNSTTMQKNVR